MSFVSWLSKISFFQTSPLSLYIYLSHLYISYFELKFNNIKQKVKNNEFNIDIINIKVYALVSSND